MSLSDAAKAAREKADRSIDRGDHALANAMQGAIDAELWMQDRSLDPPAPEDNPPPAPRCSRSG